MKAGVIGKIGRAKSLAPAGDNLLDNPGFEYGSQGWSVTGGVIAGHEDAANAHSGSRFCLIPPSANGTEHTTDYGPVVTCAAGDRLYSEAWAKTTGDGAFYTRLAFYDNASAFIGYGNTWIATMTGTYRRVGGADTAPAGSAFVQLGFGVNTFTTGNICADDFALRRQQGGAWIGQGVLGTGHLVGAVRRLLSGASDPHNLIVNGGGEEGTLGGQATGWTFGNGASFLAEWLQGQVQQIVEMLALQKRDADQQTIMNAYNTKVSGTSAAGTALSTLTVWPGLASTRGARGPAGCSSSGRGRRSTAATPSGSCSRTARRSGSASSACRPMRRSCTRGRASGNHSQGSSRAMCAASICPTRGMSCVTR